MVEVPLPTATAGLFVDVEAAGGGGIGRGGHDKARVSQGKRAGSGIRGRGRGEQWVCESVSMTGSCSTPAHTAATAHPDLLVVTVAEAGPPFALAVAEEEEKASPCRCRCRPACRCGVWCGMASSRSGKRQSKGLGEVQVGCSRQAAVTCGKRHLLRTHRHHQERAGMGKGQRVAIT